MELRICIDVADLERAIAFYSGGLGLSVGRRLGADWAELVGGPCAIDLLVEPEGSAPLGPTHAQRRSFRRHWTPVHLDFVVQDLDRQLVRLLELGATLERPVQQRSWGRMANLADPFGHGLDLLQFQGRGYDEIAASGK